MFCSDCAESMSDTLSVINTRASAFDRPCVYQSAAAAAQHSCRRSGKKLFLGGGQKQSESAGVPARQSPAEGGGAAQPAGTPALAGRRQRGRAQQARPEKEEPRKRRPAREPKRQPTPAEPTKRAGQSSAPTRPPTTAAQETRGDRGAPASPPAKNERAQTEASEDAPQRSLRPLVFGEGATCICFLSHHLRKRKGRASDLLCPCAF